MTVDISGREPYSSILKWHIRDDFIVASFDLKTLFFKTLVMQRDMAEVLTHISWSVPPIGLVNELVFHVLPIMPDVVVSRKMVNALSV